MKTKILLALLCVSLSVNAQINNVIKKSNLNVKPITTLTLPVLKAKSSDLHREDNLSKLKEVAFPKTTLVITPKPYSKSGSALNVTLTPDKMKTQKASLAFKGIYSGSRIKLYQKTLDQLWVGFNAKRNKTYRAKVKFYMFFGTNWCPNKLENKISIGGNTIRFKGKKGVNSLDFLIQSDVDGRISFSPLNWHTSRCGRELFKDEKLEYRFMSIQIQELQD